MNIAIQTKNIEMTDAIRKYVEKKLKGMDRFANTTESQLQIQVEVGRTPSDQGSGDIFRAEINLGINGNQFYAVSKKDELYAAIDDVKNEIEHQMKTSKGKKAVVVRTGERKAKKMIKKTFKKSI
jgi:putative sigma-54 modulation protein